MVPSKDLGPFLYRISDDGCVKIEKIAWLLRLTRFLVVCFCSMYYRDNLSRFINPSPTSSCFISWLWSAFFFWDSGHTPTVQGASFVCTLFVCFIVEIFSRWVLFAFLILFISVRGHRHLSDFFSIFLYASRQVSFFEFQEIGLSFSIKEKELSMSRQRALSAFNFSIQMCIQSWKLFLNFYLVPAKSFLLNME